MFSKTHIRRLYAQGANAIIRVILRLEDQLDGLDWNEIKPLIENAFAI